MGELNLDLGNVLDDSQIEEFFSKPGKELEEDTQDTTTEETDDDNEGDDTKEDKESNKKVAEADLESLFKGVKPESVGNGSNNESEDDTPSEKEGSSPTFSSIAKAFAEEGIFPDIDEETIKGIKTAEDLRRLVDEQIELKLTEKQKRVDEALNGGAQVDEIKNIENQLQGVKYYEESGILDKEDEEADNIRRQILTTYYTYKGLSQEKAKKVVDKTFEDGEDVEEAKEALSAIKQGLLKEYDSFIEKRKKEADDEKLKKEESVSKINKIIFEAKDSLFEGLTIDELTKKRAFEAVSGAKYDAKSQSYITPLDAILREDYEGTMSKLGLLYALTDGFKSLDKLVKNKAKKEIKKGFADLERKINNSAYDSKGNLHFSSGVGDSDNYTSKTLRLNI